MSIRKKQAYWEELIHTCRSSGLTDRQWCLQNNISCSSFYYNARKLRKQACELPQATGRTTAEVKHEVVPLTLLDETPTLRSEPTLSDTRTSAICLQMNGVRMDINNHAHPSLILKTLMALKELC